MTNQVLGQPIGRVDGVEKVTGSALYSSDMTLEGVLWGKVLYSPHAHARILKIDTTEAKKLPGVIAVITGADVGDGLYGSNLKDMPILARDRVRFIGERVAAVAAIDEDTAQAALDLIEVEYEELPAVFDLEEAMQPGAPVIHPNFNTYEGVTATPGPGPFGGLLPLTTPSNVYTSRSDDRGDLAKGFAEAELVIENTYYTQRQHQGYLEPQNCAVYIDPEGRINLWAGSKMPHGTKMGLAGVIGVDAATVLVHHTYIGGDFGAKATPVLLPICYHLAKVTGKPVRMVNDYLDELLSGNPRHATLIRYRTGLKRDGSITAHHVQFYVNGGAYGAFKPGGIIFGPEQAAGPYAIANTRIEAAHVYTNTIPGGYMRGPGESQAVFAIESHIDELAHAIGMDPVHFRMKNLVGEGDEAAFGVTFEHVLARETLHAAVEAANYRAPKPKNVGRGVAIGERPPGGGIGNGSITFNQDGSVSLGTPIFDQGSGTYTIMIQMAAEELGLPMDRIKLDIWNTDAVPFDSGVAGSWAARVNSAVVHEAAQAARQELIAFAARRLEWPADSIELIGDTLRSTTLNESVQWKDILSEANQAVTSGRKTQMSGLGEMSHITGFNAQVAEVEVDPDTGEIKLLNFVSAHDVGRILNPLGHQGQINGGIVAGIGYALMEEMRVEDGRVTNLSLGDYKLPTSQDLPPLKTVLLTTEHGVGPYNIKAIGEGPTTPVAPAIANAVFDACGVRLRELPLTSEKVYRALHP
ncbi:MAG TPA: xanthine dehydrogenase family protein molybdopterin-binding subunit [Dehalococcoidia bacterium]|nr:xanthine dehydrogenase family protein molybdopterin-binding subunit [Dehalococcoidia bacterium]